MKTQRERAYHAGHVTRQWRLLADTHDPHETPFIYLTKLHQLTSAGKLDLVFFFFLNKLIWFRMRIGSMFSRILPKISC